MKKTIFCKICNVDTKLVADSFGRWHLNKVHKITTKQYYDLYLKQKKKAIVFLVKKNQQNTSV